MGVTRSRVSLHELGSLPNLLTLVRIPLAGLIWLAPGNRWWLMGLMGAAALSDLLDGWFARRAGVPAEGIGAWLDPLCDKLFIASALVAVWVMHGPPLWLAFVAATRELALLPLFAAKLLHPGLRNRSMPWRAMALGKATTVVQFALFASVLWAWPEGWGPLALVAGALGLAAGVQYGLRGYRSLKSQ